MYIRNMTTMNKSSHSTKVTKFKDNYCDKIIDRLKNYHDAYKTSPNTFMENYGSQFLEDFADLDFTLSANILGLDKENINVNDLRELRDIYHRFVKLIKSEAEQ